MSTSHYIYKYPLEITDIQYIAMPVDSRILSVGNQYGNVTLWAKVATEDQGATPMSLVRIGIFGTGNILPDDLAGAIFIGTVITENGQLIWHVWEMP